MPAAIITSRTRSLFERPPEPPYTLNLGSEQAIGLAAWWPLGDKTAVYRDWTPKALFPLTVGGTVGRGPVQAGGQGWSNTGSTANYLVNSTAVLTATPLTMCGWFNVNNVTASHEIAALLRVASNRHYFSLLLEGTVAGDPVQAIVQDAAGVEGIASTTTGFVAGVPQHACGVWTSSTARAAYLNGGSKGTDTTSKTPALIDNTTVGIFKDTGSFSAINGVLWDVRIYNYALPDPLVYRLYDPPTRHEIYYETGRKTFFFKPAAGGTTTLVAARGSYTLSGQSAVLAYNRKLTAAQGTFTLSGQTATLRDNRALVAAQGAYSLSGQSATLTRNRTLTAAQGSYSLSGQSAVLDYNRNLVAGQGAYTLSGQAATLFKGKNLSVSAGSFTLSGQNATLAVSHRLTAAQGSYSLTGQAATLTYVHGVTLTASQGSYSLSGQSVTFKFHHALSAATGLYTVTGFSAADHRGSSSLLLMGS